MSERDIMPWTSPFGQHIDSIQLPLNASETYLIGECVTIDTNGEANEPADEPDSHQVVGVAVSGGNTTASTGTVDWRTGNIITTSALVQVAPFRPGARFITENLSQSGTAFSDTAPDQTDVGDGVGLTLISGVWGVDSSMTSGDMIGSIVDVLDSLMRPISESGVTLATTDTYYVVFEINAGIAATDGNTADTA